MTTHHIIHGINVKVERYLPTERLSAVRVRVPGFSSLVRNMEHDNVDEDVAHEVRVYLIRMARGRMDATKGWERDAT